MLFFSSYGSLTHDLVQSRSIAAPPDVELTTAECCLCVAAAVVWENKPASEYSY